MLIECRNCQGRGEFPDHLPCVVCNGAKLVVGDKPNWQVSNTPVVHTNPDTIGVYESALYKAFPVALKRGCGFSFKISDAAQRKVDKYLAECEAKHGDAFYRKGVLDIDGASIGIYYTIGVISLTEYIVKHPQP